MNEPERVILYATFGLGGCLGKNYLRITGRTEDNIRLYMHDHFPRDWAFLYTPEEFAHQPEQYGLIPLAKELFV